MGTTKNTIYWYFSKVTWRHTAGYYYLISLASKQESTFHTNSPFLIRPLSKSQVRVDFIAEWHKPCFFSNANNYNYMYLLNHKVNWTPAWFMKRLCMVRVKITYLPHQLQHAYLECAFIRVAAVCRLALPLSRMLYTSSLSWTTSSSKPWITTEPYRNIYCTSVITHKK